MSLMLEIGNLLENNGFGTITKDIFGYEKPDDPDNLICILPNAGRTTETIREVGIQLIIRNQNSLICEEKANEIFEFLRNLENVALGNFYVYIMEPTSDLIPLGFDKKHRYEFSMNFRVIRR